MKDVLAGQQQVVLEFRNRHRGGQAVVATAERSGDADGLNAGDDCPPVR